MFLSKQIYTDGIRGGVVAPFGSAHVGGTALVPLAPLVTIKSAFALAP